MASMGPRINPATTQTEKRRLEERDLRPFPHAWIGDNFSRIPRFELHRTDSSALMPTTLLFVLLHLSGKAHTLRSWKDFVNGKIFRKPLTIFCSNPTTQNYFERIRPLVLDLSVLPLIHSLKSEPLQRNPQHDSDQRP